MHYPKPLLSLFLPALRSGSLPVDDRLSLLNDQLALATSGDYPATDFLDLLECYREDDDCIVWECVEECLTGLRQILQGDAEALRDFHAWGQWLLKHNMDKLGWDSDKDETHLRSKFRALIVNNMVGMGNEKTIEEGSLRFDSEEGSKVAADLKTAMYACKLKRDGQKTLDKLIKMAAKATSSEEKLRVYSALGASSDLDLLQQVLDFALSDAVRAQDTRHILVGVSSSSFAGRDLAWAFFQKNVEAFKRRYHSGSMLTHLVKASTLGFVGEEDAARVEAFFEDNEIAGAVRTVKQIAEAARIRGAWREREGENVKKYLRSKVEGM